MVCPLLFFSIFERKVAPHEYDTKEKKECRQEDKKKAISILKIVSG
jgi:hypothetical protein